MAANISSLSKGLVAHYPLNGESESLINNKVINGDFENGTNNWNDWGATLESDTTVYYSGSKSIKVISDVGSGGYLFQNCPAFTIGKTYKFRAKVKSTAGTSIRFVAGSVDIITQLPTTPGIWTEVVGYWTATSAYTTFGIQTHLAGDTYWVDDFSVSEIITKDITPNANHGTNNGATLSTGRKGEANGSYSFNGNIPNSIYLGRPEVQNFTPQVDEFSISVWYKSTNRGIIYSFGGSTGIRQIQLDFTLSGFEMYLGQSDGNQNTINSALTPNYKDGNWHHIAVVIPAGSIGGKFYYDGNLVSSSLKIGSGTAVNPAYIGARTDGTGYPLWGSVSDLRIYDRQLTDSEIKLLYDSFKPEIATSDLNKGLVGHWMLDSENGAKDLTPNGNHGTANGGITIGGTTDRKGRSGGATSFDGVNDYIETGANLDFTKDRTISVWFNGAKSTQRDSQRILSTGSSTTNGFHLGVSNSNNIFYIRRRASSDLIYSNNFPKNQWIHLIILSKENGDVTFYINSVISGSPDQNRGLPTSDLVSLKIGSVDGYTGWLNSSIYDLKIYDRILSEDEIKLLYDQYKPKEASIGSLQKGLVLDMPLTTKHMKSATVVSDRTPYGNDGTVSGATVGSEYTSFDGVNDYVELNSFNRVNGQPLTVSAWFYQNSKTGYQDIVANRYPSLTYNWMLYTHATDGSIQLHGLQQYKSNIIPSLNQWHHVVAIVYEDSTYSLYLDNLLVINKTTYYYKNTLPTRMYIGSDTWTSEFFNGSISQVKIYNRALSAEEVKLLYEKGRY